VSGNDPTYVRSRSLLEAELGDELVALDVEDGLCFGFNEVATAIWRQLAQPTASSVLIKQLTQDYDVDRDECARDVEAVLAVLMQHRLVHES